MKLEISLLDINKVQANPWNPNVQTDNQYRAEKESIVANGFLAPILVRKFEDGWQVIDGEHRWRGLKDLKANPLPNVKVHESLNTLLLEDLIPAIVIDADDAKAKKLTIILNETRGRADFARLGKLLTEIKIDLPDDLGVGLPYTEAQLTELLAISAFKWDEMKIPVKDEDFEGGRPDDGSFKLQAILSPDEASRWQSALNQYKNELPKDTKLAAGALVTLLMTKAGM